MGYLEKVKKKFENKPQVYNQFLDIMKDFKSQTINTEGVIERVKTLFKGNKHLILGFNQFLPPGYKIELPPEKKTTIEFNHAVQYVAKIKNRFRDQPEIYGEFLDILHDYQANRTIDEVFLRVQKLFGGQPDLLDEFKYFLPAKSASNSLRGARKLHKSAKKLPMKKPGRLSSGQHKDSDSARLRMRVSYPPGSERDLQLLEKMKMNIPRPSWNQLVKVFHLHTLGIVTRLELVTMVEDILGEKYPEYVERFKNMIGYEEWEESQRITRQRKNYYTFVASVDFTSCPQPTPSYRRIPDDIPLPSCSGRTPLCDEVLNNRCISIPTGSEDFSFKATRKNIYEENLFKCEDERFELDMVIENNASAIRVLEPLEKKIDALTPEQAKNFALPESIDILHVRAIARMYGEHGFQIIDLLNKNPVVAIPIVLARLRQKDEEWRRVRVGMRDSWRRIAAQNYNKSLDHRSFYFKQEDKKRINPKSLLADLKDMHQYFFGGGASNGGYSMGGGGSGSGKGRQPDSDMLKQLQSGQGPLFNYCMRFKYPDQSIHNEVFNIIKYVLPFHPEIEATTCLNFWQIFIQHFFDAPEKGIDSKSARTFDSKGAAGAAGSTSAKDLDEKMEVEDDTTPAKDTIAKAKEEIKPVRLSLDMWAMDERVMPIRRHTRKSRLFFGTSSIYVLLRMHQMLYTRLLRAKELAFTHKNKATKAQLDAYAKSNRRRKDTDVGGIQANTEEAMEAEEDEAPIEDLLNGNAHDTPRTKRKTVKHPYEQFRTLLRKLLSRQMDTNHFEDELRALLGARSFVLFTIDKLISSFLKQLHMVSNSDVCKRLTGLYLTAQGWTNTYLNRAESKKSGDQKSDKSDKGKADTKRSIDKMKLRHSAQAAKMYQELCASIISHDLWCQMEYFDDTRELAIGLLDSNDSHRRPQTAEWSEYCKQFIQGTPNAQSTPFLQRNIRRANKVWEKNGDPAKAALNEVEMYCGLEFNLNTKTYKLEFVDGTEEYLLRRKSQRETKKKSDAFKAKRKKAFETWKARHALT